VTAITLVLGVLTLVAAAAALALLRRDDAGGTAGRPEDGPTAEITRGDLAVTADFEGTLGYGGPTPVYAQERGNDPDTATGSPTPATGPATGGSTAPGPGPSTTAGPVPSPPATRTTPATTTTAPTRSAPMRPAAARRPASAPAATGPATGGPGTITALPRPGTEIGRGAPVYEVDGRPVVLLFGDSPLWRPLGPGIEPGKDVAVLEHNLRALGHAGDITVDDRFTEATAEAVRRWQERMGVPPTGRVAPGDVVVRPGPVRVDGLRAGLGAPAQGEIMTVTGTHQIATVALPAARRQLAAAGTRVSVTLPDGASVTGTVTALGNLANRADGQAANPGGAGGEVTVPVEVSLDGGDRTRDLAGAPVTVRFVGETRVGVLSVPVTALLALAEGGYALEVVDGGGGVRLVPVRTGLFAGIRVEVSGDGLAPGMKVKVPAA
jgi:multidrug efflux pump subunit AcrA (membrane-fusion protein)